jgi:hypothetical protein
VFNGIGRAGVAAELEAAHGITKQKSSLRGGLAGLGLLTHLFCPLAFLICDIA